MCLSPRHTRGNGAGGKYGSFPEGTGRGRAGPAPKLRALRGQSPTVLLRAMPVCTSPNVSSGLVRLGPNLPVQTEAVVLVVSTDLG